MVTKEMAKVEGAFEEAASMASNREAQLRGEIAGLKAWIEQRKHHISEIQGIAKKNEWLTAKTTRLAYWVKEKMAKMESSGERKTSLITSLICFN